MPLNTLCSNYITKIDTTIECGNIGKQQLSKKNLAFLKRVLKIQGYKLIGMYYGQIYVKADK